MSLLAQTFNKSRPLLIKIREAACSVSILRQWIETSSAHNFRRCIGITPLVAITRHYKRTKELKVSVIIAVKNNEGTIKESIQSLLNQTHKNIEIIVVDDGSVDSTYDEISQIAETDDRVIISSNSLSFGASIARNKGLDLSSGQYITFQDGDDFAHPLRISCQLHGLLRNKSASLCMCDYVRVNPEGKLVKINDRWTRKCIVSMMFPRRIFQTIGYFRDVSISEDSDYFERIKAVYGNNSCVIVARILYKASFSPGSRMFSQGEVKSNSKSVKHRKSSEELEIDKKLRKSHQVISDGFKSPYVSSRKAYKRYRQTYNITKNRDVVSVILVLEDNVNYLDQCLESIFTQTYGKNNIELIVIANGTENGLDLIKKLQKEVYTKIKLKYKPKRESKARCLNKAVEIAKGRFVLFIEPTDYFEKHAIETSVKGITESGAALLIFDYTPLTEGGGYGVKEEFYGGISNSQLIDNSDFSDHCLLSTLSKPHIKMYRRKKISCEFALENSFFETLFHLNNLLPAKSVYVLKSNLYWQRVPKDKLEFNEQHLSNSLDTIECINGLKKKFKKHAGLIDWTTLCFMRRNLKVYLDSKNETLLFEQIIRKFDKSVFKITLTKQFKEYAEPDDLTFIKSLNNYEAN